MVWNIVNYAHKNLLYPSSCNQGITVGLGKGCFQLGSFPAMKCNIVAITLFLPYRYYSCGIAMRHCTLHDKIIVKATNSFVQCIFNQGI